MEETFAPKRLNYNTIIQRSKTLLMSTKELKDKIKKFEADIEILKHKNIELEKGIEGLLTANMKCAHEIETLKEDRKKPEEETREKLKERSTSFRSYFKGQALRTLSRASTYGGAFRTTPSEQRGAKLLVHYDPSALTPIPQSTIQHRGVYSWSAFYIKCQIPKIPVGTIAFKDLRAVLQRLFSGREIRVIRQCRGSVAGNEVAEVTSQDEDEAARPDMSPYMNHSPYCDIAGSEHTWEEAGKPRLRFIRAGGHAILCGGRRRTILTVDWK